MSIAYIYGLVCPIDGGIRYIGKSIRPKERLQNHMNDGGSCHRTHWLRKLKSLGLRPDIQILEEVPECEVWQDRERYWISHGLSLGWRLTNNTIGGDGVCGLPLKTRMKMRETWLGRKHSDETKAKIGEKSKGRCHTEDHKKAMSDRMKQREITWGHKIAESTRKLSQQDQTDILESFANGGRTGELAAKYGVHRTTISKVKTGKYVVK